MKKEKKNEVLIAEKDMSRMRKIGNISLACGIPLAILGMTMAVLVDLGGERDYLILPSFMLALIFLPLLLFGIICKVETYRWHCRFLCLL